MVFGQIQKNRNSENRRIFTGDLWWVWVNLNHRPDPYQNCRHWSRAENLRLPLSFAGAVICFNGETEPGRLRTGRHFSDFATSES